MIDVHFTPCPNDTFALAGLMTHHISSSQPWNFILEDIQTLNEKAVEKKVGIFKVSSGALRFLSSYEILSCAFAKTDHAGPVVVATADALKKNKKDWIIATPGRYTTATKLFELFFKQEPLQLIHLSYADVIPSLLDQRADAGILIHESRFTYSSYGLNLIDDLGTQWNKTHSHPLILACAVAHQSLDKTVQEAFVHDFRLSLDWAYSHPQKALDFAIGFAQEKDLKTIQAHIDHFITTDTHTPSLTAKEGLALFST
jgi:1,4-dihydroxy-6-naphthoate synthase